MPISKITPGHRNFSIWVFSVFSHHRGHWMKMQEPNTITLIELLLLVLALIPCWQPTESLWDHSDTHRHHPDTIQTPPDIDNFTYKRVLEEKAISELIQSFANGFGIDTSPDTRTHYPDTSQYHPDIPRHHPDTPRHSHAYALEGTGRKGNI